MFWWEDGYDPLKAAANEQKTAKSTIKFDGNGESMLVTRLETTGVHRLDASFLPHDSNRFITLNNSGRRFFSLAYYNLLSTGEASASELIEQRNTPVVANTGYFAISRDDRIIATAILKKDAVNLIDLHNDDLLVNFEGNKKTGYWGKMQFLASLDRTSPDLNNSMLELRVIKLDKSKPTESVLRLWDLGFRNPLPSIDGSAQDADEDDEVDDEDAKIQWEVKFPAGVCSYCATSTTIILSLVKNEKSSVLHWIDRTNGAKLREIKVADWCSKPVLSKCESVFALAHIGKCSIRDAVSGVVVKEVFIPGMTVPFPIVPVGFVHNNNFLAMRVDLDMMFALSEWRTEKPVSLVINKLGGTISADSVCLSSDEKWLACWPYGNVEIFDMNKMVGMLLNKNRIAVRIVGILMIHLAKLGRASVGTAAVAGAGAGVEYAVLECFNRLILLDDKLVRLIFSWM